MAMKATKDATLTLQSIYRSLRAARLVVRLKRARELAAQRDQAAFATKRRLSQIERDNKEKERLRKLHEQKDFQRREDAAIKIQACLKGNYTRKLFRACAVGKYDSKS